MTESLLLSARNECNTVINSNSRTKNFFKAYQKKVTVEVRGQEREIPFTGK